MREPVDLLRMRLHGVLAMRCPRCGHAFGTDGKGTDEQRVDAPKYARVRSGLKYGQEGLHVNGYMEMMSEDNVLIEIVDYADPDKTELGSDYENTIRGHALDSKYWENKTLRVDWYWKPEWLDFDINVTEETTTRVRKITPRINASKET